MLHHHTSRSCSVLNPSLCMSCLPPCYCSTCAPMASAKTVSPPTRSCVFFATPYAAASWSASSPHLVIGACLSDPPSGRIPTYFTQQSRQALRCSQRECPQHAPHRPLISSSRYAAQHMERLHQPHARDIPRAAASSFYARTS